MFTFFEFDRIFPELTILPGVRDLDPDDDTRDLAPPDPAEPKDLAPDVRSLDADLNLGRCLGRDGHSELELCRSTSRADWRIWRRVDLADLGVLGRGRAEADIPAMESSLSSSTPDVLKVNIKL